MFRISKYFASQTDLIGFFVVHTKDKNETDDSPDKSSNIGKVGIYSVELPLIFDTFVYFLEPDLG